MVSIIPFTRFLVGTSIGKNAALVPLPICLLYTSHIPEGKYTIELMEGYGGMQVLDMEHNIYVYEFFSEEYEAGTDFITECEDVRLFAGATVKILSSGVRLRFSSENAQIEEMTGIKNPLTEQVHLKAGEKLRAGKDFEAGVYNLYYRCV